LKRGVERVDEEKVEKETWAGGKKKKIKMEAG